MGEIASYYIKRKGRKTKRCVCHLCKREFKNKGAIYSHFQNSKQHWDFRKNQKLHDEKKVKYLEDYLE